MGQQLMKLELTELLSWLEKPQLDAWWLPLTLPLAGATVVDDEVTIGIVGVTPDGYRVASIDSPYVTVAVVAGETVVDEEVTTL